MPDALYERSVDTYAATALTRGPWSPEHQHAGPPSALLLREIEAASALPDAQTVRFAVDILRPVPITQLFVHTRVLRPGRRIEQIEATLSVVSSTQEVMRARAWRIARDTTALPVLVPPVDQPLPDPSALERAPRPSWWTDDVCYHDALEWRFVRGDFESPGPGCAWTRMATQLVAGEDPTPAQHLLVMGDAASGISSVLDWKAWSFVNVDFDVAFSRSPAGEWLAMDAVTRPGGTGAGTCTATLSDAEGVCATSTQALLIAPA